MIHAKTCPQCGQDFEHDTLARPTMTYCSVTCQHRGAYARRLKIAEQERRCGKCGVAKPGSQFSASHSYCRPCHAEYARERRRRGDVEEQARYRRKTHLSRYGLGQSEFDEMVHSQAGRCAICATTQPGGSGVWHVDHDHRCCSTRKTSCGKCIRGLLCSRCNIGLGNFGDDPAVLDRAADYLRRYQMSDLRS